MASTSTRVDLMNRAIARRGQRVTGEELKQLRVAFWDIEATNLEADFGLLLCASIKPYGGELKTYRLDESPNYGKVPWDDSYLAGQIRDELETYLVVVHHYGDRYDLPFLNSRLMAHNMRVVDTSSMCTIDTWDVARKKLKLSSNRLARLVDFLDTKTKKTPLIGQLWIRAMCGDKKAMDRIVEHNIRDVEALEQVTMALGRFIKLAYKVQR